MKKLKLSAKANLVLSIVFLVLSVLFFVLLFSFKGKLTAYTSKAIKVQAGQEIQNSGLFYIDSAYNYSKNGQNHEITFLEFGARGCAACKLMESVMKDIRSKYPNKVNVIFYNVMLPESQKLMKYFGIVAIPTQVLLNNEGKEFFRHTGYLSTIEFIKNLTLYK